jgi:hypothetical protein
MASFYAIPTEDYRHGQNWLDGYVREVWRLTFGGGLPDASRVLEEITGCGGAFQGST